MKVLRHLARIDFGGRPCVVTLGNFDGVHLGHQEILRRAVTRAGESGGVPVAISFYPHPAVVLTPERAPLLLGSLRQRLAALAAAGIEVVVLQHFTRRFAMIEADRFVETYVAGALKARHVVVGHTVGFGRGRAGRAALLQAKGREHGFAVEVVQPVTVGGQVVSSSAIRAALARGDLPTAARLLGRPYGVSGRVAHGHHRGQGLGFPTANLRLRGIQLPPDGVYAVRANVGHAGLLGITNIGVKPTFGDQERSVETHLFDFAGDLYGQRIEITFVERLRGERAFPTAAALAEQIREDVAAARRLMSS